MKETKRRKMKTTFCQLSIGSRFCFRGKRYEKVAADIGRDEERGGNVFHASTEVVPEMQSAKCKVKSERSLTARTSPSGRGEPVPSVWRPRPRFVRNRLGRRPDRELRPYGTL
jgi:hypothetical protein